MKSFALVVIASAIISVSIYRIGFENPQATINQEKCHNNSTQKHSAKEEHKSISHPQSIKEANNNPSPPSISYHQQDPTSSAHSKDEEIEALKLEKQASKFSQWLKDAITRDPQFDMGEYFHKNLSSEKIDAAWASEQESKLAELVRDNKNFSGIAIKAINCYSTYCKVSLSAENQEQADEILTKTSRTLYESKQPAEVIAAPNISNSETTLYIARYDNSFDFHK